MSTEDKPETALVVRQPQASALAITPSSPEQLFQMATWIGKSKMYSGIDTPEAAFTVMLRGLEMGIPMSVALTEIKPFKSGDGIKLSVSARLLESQAVSDPAVEYFRLVSSDDKQATYVAKRKGDPEITHTFTMEDAKRAGLEGKDNWKKYPKAMLRAAAARELARIVSPGKTIGLRTREEIEDDEVVYRPEPVSPLPREEPRVVLDSTAEPAHDAATGEVWSDEQRALITALGTARDRAALDAARKQVSALWPKAADAPADIQALYKEAKARVEALEKEAGR